MTYPTSQLAEFFYDWICPSGSQPPIARPATSSLRMSDQPSTKQTFDALMKNKLFSSRPWPLPASNSRLRFVCSRAGKSSTRCWRFRLRPNWRIQTPERRPTWVNLSVAPIWQNDQCWSKQVLNADGLTLNTSCTTCLADCRVCLAVWLSRNATWSLTAFKKEFSSGQNLSSGRNISLPGRNHHGRRCRWSPQRTATSRNGREWTTWPWQSDQILLTELVEFV